MNLNMNIEGLGYRWRGVYSASIAYIEKDVVYKDGGAYVIRNGVPTPFALGQQDALLKGHLLTGGVSVGGFGGMSLHMNSAGTGMEFRFSDDRNGTVAVALMQGIEDSGAKHASANDYMSAVMTDGSVRTWGRGLSGQSGTGGNDVSRTFPGRVAFPPGSPRIKRIVTSRYCTYYIDVTGGLWMSGDNAVNIMSGIGLTGVVPVPVLLNGKGSDITASTKIVDVFTNKEYTLASSPVIAMDEAGRLYAFGANVTNCLGVSTGTNVPVAKLIPFTATTPIKNVYIGGSDTVMASYLIDYNGGLWTCGNANINLAPAATAVHQRVDVAGKRVKKVTLSGTDDVAVAGLNVNFALAVITEDGDAYINHDAPSTVAMGTTSGWVNPYSGPPNLTNVDDMYVINGGSMRGVALMKDGTVMHRGFNADMLTGSASANSTVWATVGGTYLTGVTKLRVMAGQNSTTCIALRSDGRMVVWGRTPNGLRGTGETLADSLAGFDFVRLVHPVVDFSAAGYVFSESFDLCIYALTSIGAVHAWGYASYYKNGDDDSEFTSTPSHIRF